MKPLQKLAPLGLCLLFGLAVAGRPAEALGCGKDKTASSNSSSVAGSSSSAPVTSSASSSVVVSAIANDPRLALADACKAVSEIRRIEGFLASGKATDVQVAKLKTALSDSQRRLKVNAAQFESASGGQPFSAASCETRAIAAQQR